MVPTCPLGDKFFQWLVEIDEETSRRVAAAGCPWCKGPLHRGDYPRKPRGGLFAVAGEVFTRRISLCCGREGCRRRSTPPSVRFLGRRVYLGLAVVLGSVVAQAMATAREVRRATGVPARTVRRWREWWHTAFPQSRLYQEEQARFVPPLENASLPASLYDRLDHPGHDADQMLVGTLCFLAPLTTTSVTCESGFVRTA